MDKKTVILPVCTTILVLLLSACAGKTAVSEAPADKAGAEATEPAQAQAPEESKKEETKTEKPEQHDKVVEVIPLDASSAEAAAGDKTDSTAESAKGATQAAANGAETAAAPQEPMAPPDIQGITHKMLDLKYTLWHSRDKTYRLYVGKQFEAEYSPDSNTLLIRSDEPGSDLACKYAMDGKLDPDHASEGKACKTLIKTMDNYVSNN